MKIIVLRFSSLGDVILTTPLLRLLKQKYPESEIHYCVKSSYSDILRFNPNISRLIIADDNLTFRKLNQLRKVLSENSYDLILDCHNNLRTFYLKLFLRWKSKVKTFKKYSFRKFVLVNFKINLMRNLPKISERYNQLICGTTRQFPEIFTGDEHIPPLKHFPAGFKQGGVRGMTLICIIPSARHFTKTYPPEYFAELMNKFDKGKYAFLLIGKGKDKANIEIIKNMTGPNVYDFCDKLNLLELTEIMKKCRLVISGDTGPMHIAEALNIPLLMIAGSSVREFGFFPSSENSVVIENEGLKCRPCSHIGRNACPLGHFKCMRDLKPEMVYQKIFSRTDFSLSGL